MKPYVFMLQRLETVNGRGSVVSLPQFQVHASSPEGALAKARAILGDDTLVRAHVGAMTDGDHVWDLATGRRV